MPLNGVESGISSLDATATRSALRVDDSAALLLGKADAIRPLQKSRNPFRRGFSQLPNDDKQEFSEFSDEQWLPSRRWCPEEEAGWLSRLFFLFANSLVAKGARKHLEQSDLWHTAHQDQPQRLWDKFEQQLQATANHKAPQGCFWRALYHVHSRVFAITGFIKLWHDLIMFSQPYILEQLLHHLTGARDKYVALGLAFALLGAALLEALMINVYFNMLFRMSLHTKTQLLEMLYRKSLRVSSAVKSDMGVGPIVNLQSNDAAKLWTMPTYLHMVWNGPFQVIVVMAMLVRVLSVWPALAGLCVTVAIIPLTMMLGRLLTAARKESVAAADQRVKLVTEVITGIKAIKLYAWEEPYLSRITDLREAELKAIRRTQLLSMINNAIFNTGPVLVSLAAFGVYAALGYSLTAAVAFPSLALFNLLRFPIVMIPQQIMNLIAATVGIGRIQKFMDSEEMAGVTHLSSSSSSIKPLTQRSSKRNDPHSTSSAGSTTNESSSFEKSDSGRSESDLRNPDSARSAAVQISRSSFAWDGNGTDSSAVLHDVQLAVPQGSLVIIVGPVGSGKSSLLNAVLGELVAVSSSSSSSRSPVSVAGSVAYTAQDPWIQNATLRNNLLMGLPFDQDQYNSCVEACCLEKDLQMLPAGDQSEIGEKGINLSGGQKHRVALARAVYAAADVYLLDDPLSAVDVHVGRHLFERCICGQLACKTRLLVTHQLQYLPHADLVVVMLDGCVKHTGTYQQLAAQGVDLAAFVPLKEQQTTEQQQQQPPVQLSSQQHPQQQQQQSVQFVLESPVLTPVGSPKAAETTAVEGAVTGLVSNTVITGASGVTSRGLADSRANDRSFSGSVIELPSYLTPTAPALSTANSFASHKPLKVSQEFLEAAGVAPGNDHGPQVSVLNSTDSSSGSRVQRPNTLETIEDVLDESDVGSAPEPPAAVQVGAATAAAARRVTESPDGTALVILNSSSGRHQPLDDEVDDDDHQQESVGLIPPQALRSDHGMSDSASSNGRPLVGLRDKLGKSERVVGESEAAGRKSDRAGSDQKGRLVKAEERAKGQVKRSVYVAYLSAWGAFFLLPIAVTLGALVERGLQVLQNYVLSVWSNATSKAHSSPSEPLSGHDTGFYLALYFILGLSSVGLVLVRSAWLVLGSIAASRKLHTQLLAKMLRLPMSFYDSQPTGRLINRFTKDTEALDIQMAAAVNSALTCLVGALLSIVVVVAVSPYTLLALIPLALLYYRVQRLYIATSRELKRLDALAFSPIFQHYGESLAGLATIRAFGRQQLFADINRGHIQQSNRAWWPIQLLNRWLSMRLELTGSIVVFITAVAVGVIAPRNAGLAGLALTSALNLTGTLAWMVRQTTELEVNMNSVERLVEYRTQVEEAAAITLPRPPHSWPQAGAVQAVQLVVRYRPELPPVLKGISFSINAGEKIGICGRTGCGKSTLMMVLFRMIEPSGGAILIDGLETSKIGLTDLRSRLSLVPQDPVIFSGTVRSNLDPFGQAGSDAAIWEALRQAGMQDLVRSLGAGLDSPIQEGGNNLSSGQRQLLCMARALLRSSRILILDEATSNVDQASDSLIQKTIRSAFSHCTVLTIAHRLHTIADADRVMVLDQGLLKEFDAPARLMKIDGGVFRGLMEEAGRHHSLASAAVL